MQALDAALYGVVTFGIAVVPLVLLSFAVGTQWTGVKTALFLLWLGYGVAGTWKLRPQPPKELDIEGRESDGDDDDGSRGFSLGIGRAFGLGGNPSALGRDEDDLDRSGVESDALDSAAVSDVETGVAAIVHRLPPASLLDFSAEERASTGLRFMGASAVMFLVSFAMEAVFRVGYPGGPA